MDQAALESVRQRIDHDVRERLPDVPVREVAVLQYGDAPEVEPGELLTRVVIEAGDTEEEHKRAADAFHHAHDAAINEFWDSLAKFPEFQTLEVKFGDDIDLGHGHGARVAMVRSRKGRRLEAEMAPPGEPATAVMARLARVDLDTLDTLVMSGIAPSRAEAVRWALARIRERPAYERLQERAREIEDLKAQF